MKREQSSDGFPEAFVDRLTQQYPEQASELLETFGQRPPVIRANLIKITADELATLLKEQGIETETVLLLPYALNVTNADRKQLTSTQEWQDGLFYIQSIASQLAVKALDPQPGETILDLCSAPGSKTTQIAALMNKEGALMANDNNRKRIYRLESNLKQQHMDDFVEVKNYSGQNYPKHYPDTFDRILVDAPCSSEARFCLRYPKTHLFWSRHKVKGSAKTQRRLLDAALKCVKPGGVLIYSTCTFAPEENEMVITKVLKKHPDVQIEALDWDVKKLPILESWNDKEVNPEVQKAIRLWPDELVEGFFICRMRRISGESQ